MHRGVKPAAQRLLPIEAVAVEVAIKTTKKIKIARLGQVISGRPRFEIRRGVIDGKNVSELFLQEKIMDIDLSTKLGGLELKSPLIVGACPMTANELSRIAMVSAGAGAIVLPSLYEEQVVAWTLENGMSTAAESSESTTVASQSNRDLRNQAKRLNPFAIEDADSYLELVRRAAGENSVPVIASLDGFCDDKWLDFAGQLESAGAAAFELIVRQPHAGCDHDPRKIEDAIIQTATRFDEMFSIPLFLKLGRSYTSLPSLAERLLGKAQGLVMFGQAPELDISLSNLEVVCRWGLTEPGSLARSIESIMRTRLACPAMPVAASGGIGDSGDLIKAILAGADAAMVTSAVYRDGPDIIRNLLDGLTVFLQRHHLDSVTQLNGLRQQLLASQPLQDTYTTMDATPLDRETIRCGQRKLHCDRWGHVTPAT